MSQPLFDAILSDDLPKVIRFLEDNPNSINAEHAIGPFMRYTPLTYAIAKGKEIIALVLLDKGANPHIPTSRGMTSLMLAVELRSLPLVRTLIQKEVDVNAMDKRGFTALSILTNVYMYECENSVVPQTCFETTKLLVEELQKASPTFLTIPSSTLADTVWASSGGP